MWLNRLLDTMQSTIRHEMTEAVVSYEEKPRDQWLFEPPAQVINIVLTHKGYQQCGSLLGRIKWGGGH